MIHAILSNMAAHWWSYALAPFSLAGMWLVGKKRNYRGWLLSFTTQFVWLAYAIDTQQYGFMPGTIGYMCLYWASFQDWRRDARAKSA